MDPAAVGRDGDVGNLGVERGPRVHQLREALTAVAVGEQRTVAAVAHAVGLLSDRGLEIHHAAALGEAPAVLGQQHRAAPGGEHDARERRERIDRLALALPEARFAFLLEDEGNVDTGSPLDRGVAVVEGEPERAGQVAPDRGLARAHGADEEYASLAEHAAVEHT